MQHKAFENTCVKVSKLEASCVGNSPYAVVEHYLLLRVYFSNVIFTADHHYRRYKEKHRGEYHGPQDVTVPHVSREEHIFSLKVEIRNVHVHKAE